MRVGGGLLRAGLAGLALGAVGCAAPEPPARPDAGAGGAGGSPLAALRDPCCGVVDVNPVVCAATADAGAFTFVKVATWRDDARAAYAMIHDDVCGPALRGIDQYAVPALALRNLTAGLGPFVQVCEQGNLWGMVKDAESKGNEIVNHSFTHPNITVANAPQEVVMSKQTFDGKLTNPITFFIFPFDFWTADTLKAVADAGHFGARAGSRDDNDGFENPPVNGPDPGNDMALEFDVWPRTYSKYALFAGHDILDQHVWSAIDRGAFSVREMHSISALELRPEDGSQGFGPVPLRTYEDHLDFLVQAWRANLVWTSTPSTIIRYRHARAACKAVLTGSTLSFVASDPECVKFATPLSVVVATDNDVPGMQATQLGKPVFTRKLAPATFSIDADPTAGDVQLAGCLTPSSAVDPALDKLPPRPSPARSVCDLELVKGTGSPGSMDNLDRRPEQLRVLPNPAQGDGRTGSWSWYPNGLTTAEIVRDGMNGYLRFTGGNLGAFAGTTLAFLGGNGAGSCYDATAYHGVRFKIRGVVTSTDSLAGSVVVSVVTAETQTQKYGGDLMGEGGHFNKIVPITAEWQTVSIAWSEFMPPTWGATAGLGQLAVGKLQAIDWGVTSAASRFEIFLDAIVLY